jgi:hypothetical protein
MSKEYYTGKVTCHICRLPIPQGIVSNVHPLFGTVDHIRPMALGGLDVPGNRAPAHRLCNLNKSSRSSLPDDLRNECRSKVYEEFARLKNAQPLRRRAKGIKKLKDVKKPPTIRGVQWTMTFSDSIDLKDNL